MKNATDGKAVLKERFVELRAEGRSYADIAKELSVSKPTLFAWSEELSTEIANARALRLDGLFERFLVAKEKRVEAFGKRLEGILVELDTRNLKDLKTEALLTLALKYGESLRTEYEPILLKKERSLFDDDPLTVTDRWPA